MEDNAELKLPRSGKLVANEQSEVELNLVVTDIGLAKIAGATVEEPLILEKFAVGDGNGSEVVLDPARRDLVNEKYRDLLNNKYSNNNNIVIECVLRANAPITEGFYLRELGVFDVDGDLIAHAKLPEQYRPPLEEGQIVTENIFNINLKIQNTENIQVFIEETVFATEDSVQRLLDRVEKIEKDKEAFINSSIGIEKHFNTDNKYKDQDIIKIGIKTYALMESTNILNIADYPILFKNIGAVDRGDGTFAMPNFFDGTLRHLAKGTTRNLGVLENDDIKSHAHTQPAHTHTIPNHTHTVKTKTRVPRIYETIGGGRNGFYWEDDDNTFDYYEIDSPEATTSSSGGGNTGSSGAENTGNTGGDETRMKNTSGQWYILAKVEFE